MPHPWNCSRPGWMRLWATWSSGWHPCPWQQGWNWMIFKVPSNPSHSMILWSHGGQCQKPSWSQGIPYPLLSYHLPDLLFHHRLLGRTQGSSSRQTSVIFHLKNHPTSYKKMPVSHQQPLATGTPRRDAESPPWQAGPIWVFCTFNDTGQLHIPTSHLTSEF